MPFVYLKGVLVHLDMWKKNPIVSQDLPKGVMVVQIWLHKRDFYFVILKLINKVLVYGFLKIMAFFKVNVSIQFYS